MGCPQLPPMSDAWQVAPPLQELPRRRCWRALRGLACSQVSLLSSASTRPVTYPPAHDQRKLVAPSWSAHRHRRARFPPPLSRPRNGAIASASGDDHVPHQPLSGENSGATMSAPSLMRGLPAQERLRTNPAHYSPSPPPR